MCGSEVLTEIEADDVPLNLLVHRGEQPRLHAGERTGHVACGPTTAPRTVLHLALGLEHRSHVPDVALADAVADDQAVLQRCRRRLLGTWRAARAGGQLATIASHGRATIAVEAAKSRIQ